MTAAVSGVPDSELVDSLRRLSNPASDPDTHARTGPIRVAWKSRTHLGDPTAPQAGTVRCAACSWTFVGPFSEGAVQHKAHRKEAHYLELAASSSRQPGQRKGQVPTLARLSSKALAAREKRLAAETAVKVMVAELEKGPRTTRQLADVTGLGVYGVGTALTWARKNGRTTANTYPGATRREPKQWHLKPPGPEVESPKVEEPKPPRPVDI